MTNTEKAEKILKALDEVINVNWNFENAYIKAIIKALNNIDREERKQIGGTNDEFTEYQIK